MEHSKSTLNPLNTRYDKQNCNYLYLIQLIKILINKIKHLRKLQKKAMIKLLI